MLYLRCLQVFSDNLQSCHFPVYHSINSYIFLSKFSNFLVITTYNLPPVVFHSFRHSSVTYKLKLNGGDIKAVQGDSGHAQVNMVTDVYSHILDDDRRKNAELFEEAFYEKKNLDPQMHVQQENNNATVADEIDPELLAKVLANPEMRALLNSLAKTMK